MIRGYVYAGEAVRPGKPVHVFQQFSHPPHAAEPWEGIDKTGPRHQGFIHDFIPPCIGAESQQFIRFRQKQQFTFFPQHLMKPSVFQQLVQVLPGTPVACPDFFQPVFPVTAGMIMHNLHILLSLHPYGFRENKNPLLRSEEAADKYEKNCRSYASLKRRYVLFLCMGICFMALPGILFIFCITGRPPFFCLYPIYGRTLHMSSTFRVSRMSWSEHAAVWQADLFPAVRF